MSALPKNDAAPGGAGAGVNGRNRLSDGSALESARDLLKRGFAVVPVGFKTKRATVAGWPDLRLKPDDLPKHFGQGPMNVGVLLGEPSGWIVDVDLDHPRAVELADSFLPHTDATWGRASKPESHRLYRLTSPALSGAFRTKDRTVILELRSTKLMTVAPGSTHLTGERIEWCRDGEPAAIGPKELLKYLYALRDAVVAASDESCTHPTPDTSRPCDPVDPVDPVRSTGKGSKQGLLGLGGGAAAVRAKDPVDPVRAGSGTGRTGSQGLVVVVDSLELDPVDPVRLTGESMTIDQVIDRCRVIERGQHDTQNHNLARGLKLNAGVPDLQQARTAFDRWWQASSPHCDLDDADAAWSKFARAWMTASIPLGAKGITAQVLSVADRLPMRPEGATFGPKVRLLVNALAEISRCVGGEPFLLTTRQVADAFKVSVHTAWEWVSELERCRIIRVVDRGKSGEPGKGGKGRRVVFIPAGADSGPTCTGGRNAVP